MKTIVTLFRIIYLRIDLGKEDLWGGRYTWKDYWRIAKTLDEPCIPEVKIRGDKS